MASKASPNAQRTRNVSRTQYSLHRKYSEITVITVCIEIYVVVMMQQSLQRRICPDNST